MFRVIKLCIAFMLLLTWQSISAAVYTTSGDEPEKKGVYIIGNEDMYPLEYYNAAENKFDGVLPTLLETISEGCGIDFTYVYRDDKGREHLTEDLRAEMVSTYTTNRNAGYYPGVVTLLSYVSENDVINVGWRFTEYANSELIDKIKAEASKITEQEINALLMQYAEENSAYSKKELVAVLMSALLLGALAAALIRLIKIHKLIHLKETTDSATGIGNLLYFQECFGTLLGEDNYIAYLIVDSNYLQLYHGETDFKDAVKYVADTLTYYVSQNEIAAKISENGFAIVFKAGCEEEAGEYIKELAEQLSVYIERDGKGDNSYFRIVSYKLSSSDNNCELLLFNLRKNCANLMGTEQVFMFCTKHMLYSSMEKKAYLEEIANAFKNKEFKLYLQFIFDSKSKKIVSAEALSRWDRGDKGIVFPGSYIDVMEKAGIISQLDYYMLDMACMQLHKWKDTLLDGVSISCNFTRITLSEKDFIERVQKITNRYVFDKENIVIEITEDAIEKNRETAINNILKCKAMGFKIALDDLGSGYTSLSNLCDYPIDIVKIDRSILLKTNEKNGRDLFSGVVAMAHSLGLRVVCEGIETEEQNSYVAGSECDLSQGWYFVKALPIGECEKFYKDTLK